jgi:hypothetical protein
VDTGRQRQVVVTSYNPKVKKKGKDRRNCEVVVVVVVVFLKFHSTGNSRAIPSLSDHLIVFHSICLTLRGRVCTLHEAAL